MVEYTVIEWNLIRVATSYKVRAPSPQEALLNLLNNPYKEESLRSTEVDWDSVDWDSSELSSLEVTRDCDHPKESLISIDTEDSIGIRISPKGFIGAKISNH